MGHFVKTFCRQKLSKMPNMVTLQTAKKQSTHKLKMLLHKFNFFSEFQFLLTFAITN